MSEETQELVTKIDVLPDLAGLISFEQEVDRARQKVLQLSRAINRVNDLQPKSRYAPQVNNPAANAAAASLATGLGANLVSRTALAPVVQKAAKEVAKKTTEIPAKAVEAAVSSTGTALATIGRQFEASSAGGLLGLTGGAGGAGGHAGGGRSGAGGFMGGALAHPRQPGEGMDFSKEHMGTFTIGGTRKAEERAAAARKSSGGLSMPNMMAGAMMAGGLALGLDAVADSMDRIQSSEQQLARLPQTIGSSKDAFIDLNNAATQVRSDGDAFISTYTNMATATEKLGLSQAQTTKATQGLVSALQLGGGSKQAVTNALYQMGQAFSSDRFGGDEFRSFMEAIGTQAPEVAKAFGTDVKGLRAMSTAGKLTAETMVKAFEKMADQNIELLNKQGWTWGQVTTVMKNDWTNFLAAATEGGEWSRLMNYVANNILPGFRDAEQVVAKFWATTTDESKANILLGILAAIGAGFVALAVPVLAATWPFIAVGVAVWALFEIFQEFQHWLDGSAKTMFDSMFGSFDDFEKRYPNIIAGLKKIGDLAGAAKQKVESIPGAKGMEQTAGELATPSGLFGNAWGFVQNKLNPLPGLEWFLGDLMTKSSELKGLPLLPPALTQQGQVSKQTTITNSGNTTIQVATPEEAAAVANKRDIAFMNHLDGNGLDNIAEANGAI